MVLGTIIKLKMLAHPTGWERDKELVLEFYIQRFNNTRTCQPNNAHRAIARLQDGYNVINLTQNIDDLLEHAGCKDVDIFAAVFNKPNASATKSCSISMVIEGIKAILQQTMIKL